MDIQPLVERINMAMSEAKKYPNCPWQMAVKLRKARTIAEVREFGSNGLVPYPEGHDYRPYDLAWLQEIDTGLQEWLADARKQSATEQRLSSIRAAALTVMSPDDLDFLLDSMSPRG